MVCIQLDSCLLISLQRLPAERGSWGETGLVQWAQAPPKRAGMARDLGRLCWRGPSPDLLT